MAITPKRLAGPMYVPDSAGVIYANPAGFTSTIANLIIHNTNVTTETILIYVVPDNAGALGTPGVTNIMYSQDIEADATIEIEVAGIGIVLEDENDSIQMDTNTASKVNVILNGFQST